MAKVNAKRMSGADIAAAAAQIAAEDVADATGIERGLSWEQTLVALRRMSPGAGLRWGASNYGGGYTRVYMRGDEVIVELTAKPGAGTTLATQRWGVLARWCIWPKGHEWITRSWDCVSEMEALRVLDALGVGLLIAFGPVKQVGT